MPHVVVDGVRAYLCPRAGTSSLPTDVRRGLGSARSLANPRERYLEFILYSCLPRLGICLSAMLLQCHQTHLFHLLLRLCCEAVLVLLVVLVAGVFCEGGLLGGALEVGEALQGA